MKCTVKAHFYKGYPHVFTLIEENLQSKKAQTFGVTALQGNSICG
jgi:hypothetical protein